MVPVDTFLCTHKTVLANNKATTRSLLTPPPLWAAAPKPIDPSFFGLNTSLTMPKAAKKSTKKAAKKPKATKKTTKKKAAKKASPKK